MSEQNEEIKKNNVSSFAKYLTPMGAFALAFGSSLGWGSFVMPGTTFLPSAGPLGSIIGFLVGIISMLIVCINYDYMIKNRLHKNKNNIIYNCFIPYNVNI